MLSKGHAFERVAEKYLLDKGYKLRSRNYHCKRGEIDLIMEEANTLIFVEVRYRKSSLYGTAEESITKAKQSKIVLCANHYIAKFKLWNMAAQFDVVTIKPVNKNKLEINWLKNAFY